MNSYHKMKIRTRPNRSSISEVQMLVTMATKSMRNKYLYGTLSRISYFLLSVEEQVNFKLKRPNQLTILTAGGAGCRLQSRTDVLHDEISFICLVMGGVLLHNDFDSTFRLYYDAK